MQVTAGQIINASLKRIIVLGAEADVEPPDAQDFIFNMNTWMFGLDAAGTTLGYTEVKTVEDLVTVPDGAIVGIVDNMAIRSSPDYGGGSVTQELRKMAEEGLRIMKHLGGTMSQTHFPSTLPIGSGNEGTAFRIVSHFYANREADILAEINGPIALEDDTQEA